MNKKRLMIFIILAVVSAALAVSLYFLPIVHLVAKDNDLNVVSNENVTIFQYIKQAVFVSTDAFDVYFAASGPIWLAVAGIMFGFLILSSAIITFVLAVFEIASIKANSFNTKKNNLAKKLALFCGFSSLFLFIFNIVAFLLTTAMSNNYVEFYPALGCYVGTGLSLAIIILAFLCGKRSDSQQQNKVKNSLGFLLSAIFAAGAVVLFFVPLFSRYFLYGKQMSLWTVGEQAVLIPARELPIYGDYPIGFLQWAMLFSGFVAAFIFVYGIVGFVLVLCGKQANWLSIHIKRWSIVFLIVYFIVQLLAICSVSVITTTFVLDQKYWVVLPTVFAFVLAGFLPVAASHIISSNKKEKKTK